MINYVILMRFFGELMSTALLVSVGCMGCLNASDGPIPQLQMALHFGLVHILILHCFGNISGAHANPSVTFACYMAGYIRLKIVFIYTLAQFMGACMGFGMITLLAPKDAVYDAKPPLCLAEPNESINEAQAFGVEFFLTSVLILSWCALWDERGGYLNMKSKRAGFLFAACCLAGSTLTGGTLNPARYLGPAIFHQNFEKAWIYLGSQYVAAFLIPIVWKRLFKMYYLYLASLITCMGKSTA